jgi:membrane protease YdiL (CAAX protease family)
LFALGSVASAIGALRPDGVAGFSSATSVSSDRLVRTMAFELAVAAAIAAYLWLRGWTLSRFRFEPSWKATGLGIVLYGAFQLAYVVAALAFGSWIARFYGDGIQSLFRVDADAAAIVAMSIVNPAYEESFVVGYVVRNLEGRASLWTAINVSTAIRLTYHLYQGPVACAAIIPMGVISAWFCARHGKLWALIVAHALSDFIGLSINRIA